ncbi:hypothetical protein DV738_g363, partial [Chaetothyriales sp. CBS 135597]
MVLHNPNNWHWVNKDATPWARDYINSQITGLSAEEDGVSAKISKLSSLDGDVEVSQRKGKVISIFDVSLHIEYEGKNKEGADVSGSIRVPECAYDTGEDDFVFEIDIYGETAEKQPVKDLVRSKIVPQLRKALIKLGPALIQEHGKDLQHAPDSNPASGVATPTWHPQRERTPIPAGTTKTTTTAKSSVNTTTVTATDEFRTTAEELYRTFTDPQRLAAFTRAPPKVFEGAKPKAKFAIFDGNVTGEFVTLDEPTKIVQKWRLAQWPSDHYSEQEIVFDQNDVDRVTNLRVTWTGVPVGQEEVVQRNWEGYYVRSIKQTFGLPTTVYRLQLLPKSNLSAFTKDEDPAINERVLVSDDGLIYPRVSDKLPKTNGPIFMPNTILMQDLTRLAFDQYIEEDETRKPVMISLKKGPYYGNYIPILSAYIGLNHVLDELYSSEATITDAEEWFDQHPFHDAAPDTYAK